MCLFKHKWSKWQEVQVTRNHIPSTMQQRTCLKCNLKQVIDILKD